ncbi:hypothetical protein MMG00_07340 [Ignatzschineria rhizosphaerae]|uniref:Uncharacterized protein n=1 Tax=Ignatzschineria rhizosphaerae TaxID=2923279 RepID=A0ABY3WWR8_9GAMM|nr:hypothetical protein [Ignatzschineria rhizosphaerae]UNM95053.1 hypothetical protein MMG00_07340 [Ignatzschineria rhizosphaerae]
MFIPETRVMSYQSPHHDMTIDLIANRNPKLKTKQCHILELPILCTRSQNPGAGSELYIRYEAKGYFLELFSLDRYIAAFYLHQEVRDIEFLTQEVAKDCANALGHQVIVEAYVNLNGVKQKQEIIVEAMPSGS